MGELYRAVRKTMRLKMDVNADGSPVNEEIAYMIIYLCAIANRYNIDIEEAFLKKEEINKKRKWV